MYNWHCESNAQQWESDITHLKRRLWPLILFVSLSLGLPDRALGQIESRILPVDTSGVRGFSNSISVSGDVAIAGAMTSDGQQGAAFIFRWNGSTWQQEQRLAPADSVLQARFGENVAVDSEVALVGASASPSGLPGAAYVFRWDGNSWQQEAKLSASTPQGRDVFGISVDLKGDLALIGASAREANKGAAYLYRRVGDSWQEEAILAATDGQAGDGFGIRVKIGDGELLVGSFSADNQKGAVYIFQLVGDVWKQTGKLSASNGVAGDNFSILSTHEDLLVVGALGVKNDQGAAYVFRRQGGFWQEEAILSANDGADGEWFGRAITVRDNQILIGARFDSARKGAAYLFRYINDTWHEVAKLTASDAAEGDWYGTSVELSDERAFVGSYKATGVVYAYSALPTATERIDEALPGYDGLSANYPNPFNSSTTFTYSLSKAATVTISVYDLLGRTVAEILQNQYQKPGQYQVQFDAMGLSSGTYIYQLETSDLVQSRLMVLQK